jgi:hypothetical protein
VANDEITYYCDTFSWSDSLESALAGANADRANMATGCDNGPWTAIGGDGPFYPNVPDASPWQIGFTGTDDAGNDVSIGESYILVSDVGQQPSVFHHAKLVSYEYDEYVVIGSADAGNTENPGLWSRFDIRIIGSDLIWRVDYCATRTDATSFQEAGNAMVPDATNETEGCNGGPWSVIQ